MQGPTCRWRWDLHALLVIVAAALVSLCLSGRGLLGRPEREVIREARFTTSSVPPRSK